MRRVDQSALSSGILLSERYHLEDLINESHGASTWLARDQLLNRRVGIQAIPSDDPRAAGFAEAARRSTSVTDPRFLRVLDIADEDHGHTVLVREWARALPLDLVLTQSTLTNRRSATVISEVAEAVGDAHETGVYHRHLQPGCILLKENGAVRITGLAVDHALRSPDPDPEHSDIQYAEQLDVQALGRLLYACLSGRWPGGGSGMLRQAPTEHGRLLRPRQVRAGVSRDVDTVCDRILGTPPRHHETPLRSARQIAHELRMAGEDETVDDQPSLVQISSPDLFRHDPVAAPTGPPPAVNPPKRKPKALAPRPMTLVERGKARARRAIAGDRALIWTGVGVALALVIALAFIIGRTSGSSESAQDQPPQDSNNRVSGAEVSKLAIKSASDFDPEGGDRTENPEQAELAIDGDRDTGWITSEYYGRSDLGGLKDGVGLMIDLGSDKVVSSVELVLGGSPTSVNLMAAQPGATEPPTSIGDLRRLGGIDDAKSDDPISLTQPVLTRYLLVWLTDLPPKSDDVYQGDVREVIVRGTK